MRNPADLKEICEQIIASANNGDPVTDVIEQTPYSETELIYELALAYDFRYWPEPPYRISSYNAVRGPTWTIEDGNGRHIATIFEERAAQLIVARLNG